MDEKQPVDPDFKRALAAAVMLAPAAGFLGAAVSLDLFDSERTTDPTAGEFFGRAAAISFVVGFVAFWVIGMGLALLPSRRAAAKAHAEKSARQRREAAAANQRDQEEKRQERRRSELSQWTIGSKEWSSTRFKHHVYDVFQATGVRWESYMWKSARRSEEVQARDLMKELLDEDREVIREAKRVARNRRMTPSQRSRGITSWQEAERFAADWMRRHYTGVEITGAGADGGIDVRADGVVAQVKWSRTKVGRPTVQKLRGAGGTSNCLLFSAQGYSTQAIDWADEHNVTLLAIDADGEVTPCNELAVDLLDSFDARERLALQRRSSIRGRDDVLGAFYSWLESNGLPVLPEPPDGIDLLTTRLAIKVCWSPTNPLGRPSLEQIAAAAGERRPVLAVSVPKGLSAPAQAFADERRIPVFGVSAGPTVEPLNAHARGVIAALRMRDG